MNMFLRRVNRDPCLLLSQSFRSLSTVLLSPTVQTISDCQSRECGRHSYASMPSLRQLLRSVCTSQSSAGFQEVAGSFPPRPSSHKRAPLYYPNIFQKYINMRVLNVTPESTKKHKISMLGSLFLSNTFDHSWSPDRVMVVEDWEHSLAPIEWMVYDHGMQLAALGDDDLTNCKAEYAASFDTKSRTATIASIIWKSRKIIDCQINHGLTCSSYGESQGVALHNVLTRGRQLGIWNLDVVTDVALHDKVLKGTHDIDKTPYPHICMAFIQAAKQYKICRSRLEPSEMLGLVNDMAKSKNMEHFELQEMLAAKGAHCIWGIPIFRIAQVKRKIMSKLDAKGCSPKVTFPTNCYIEVPEKSMKLDALAGILSVLEANLVIVLTGSYRSASEVQSVMGLSYKCSVIENTSHVDVKLQDLTNDRSAMIYVDQFEIPHVEADKFLVIVFDASKDPIHFSANQIHSNALLVNIITPSQKDCISGSEEANPMLYGFFRSCGGIVLHEDGPTRGSHSRRVPTI